MVTQTIGRGYRRKETNKIEQPGETPSTPLYVDEPRMATILWFAADTSAQEAETRLKQFLASYFKFVKEWL